MPWYECPVIGCGELSRSTGRCEKHSKQLGKGQKERRHHEPFYNTGLWHRTRRAYGAENPLCEDCLKRGITKVKDMVHHIVPIRDGGSKTAWSNLESLCWACHGKA